MATIDATPATVAALLRARTKDQGGRELGEWTDETRPTLAQVDETIAIAAGIVEAKVGTPVDACAGAFAVAITFEAACLIEKSYFPEQVESGRSHYDQLRAEADAVLEGVKSCQAGNLPGDDGERTWQVYDICTPAGPGCGPSDWPADYWQRDLENPMPEMAGAAQITGETALRADLAGMARAALDLETVLGFQARRAAQGITGVAHGSTGRLEKSIASAGNREVTRSGFQIGVGNFYGHMVFGGTSHSAPEPPKIPGDIGRDTARAIGDYIVRHRHGVA